MKVRKDYISTILKYVYLLSFVYIYLVAIFYVKGEICGISYPFVFIGTLVFTIAVIYLISKVKKKNILGNKDAVRKENMALIIVSVLLFFIQIIIVWNVIFRTSWDPGAVWYGAHYVSQGNIAGIEEMAYYFSIYPNNLLLVFIYSVLLRMNDLVGTPISNGIIILAVFQCVLITMAGVLLFQCAKRFVETRVAWVAYAFYFILVGISPWIMIPYSDSSGLIFPIALLYLYIRFKEVEDIKKKTLTIFSMVVLGYIGYYIKPMAVIVLIAIACIEITEFIRGLVEKREVEIKRLGIYFVTIIIGLILSVILGTTAVQSMNFPVVTDIVLGGPYHILLGLNTDTNGGYNQEDFDFATSFATGEEMSQAVTQEILNRIKEFGVTGLGEHFVKKSARTFYDGTMGWGGGETFYTEIFPQRAGKLCPLLRAIYYDNSQGYLYEYHAFLRQILWFAVLIGSLFAVGIKENMNTQKKVLVLSVLGLMLFIMVFEAHARYVFTFVPIYIVLAVIGFGSIFGKFRK